MSCYSEVGFVERVARYPARPVVRSQRLELSSDSQFDVDEPLTEIWRFYQHYTVRCAHHFSFDPHVEDLISRRCGLAPISSHPLWDDLAPSFVDGIDSCKLDHLQYPHTHDSLSEVGVGDSDSGSYGHCHLHSALGCEY